MSKPLQDNLTILDALNTSKTYHIDGDMSNSNPSNLVELNFHEYENCEKNLTELVYSMVKNHTIIFDRENKKYVLNNSCIQNTIERSYGFEHIAIKQKKNICQSRLDVNINSEIIKGVYRPVPLIAANMSTVVNADFCKQLYKLGALGILHRADTKENILKDVASVASECDLVAASVGVDKDQFEFAKELIRNKCNIIVIDIAHGYSDYVLDLGRKIKSFSKDVKVIIGNCTNTDILEECGDFADAVKVGIAQGLACETKNTAGCTEKQFSAVLKFKTLAKNIGMPIISDGGIREPADFTKAIAAGANSVMAGSIFAVCPESAAETVQIGSSIKKVYAGMASEYVQNKWKGGLKQGTCAEGGVRYLDLGQPVDKVLELYSGALKSGITYSGSNDINSFQKNVEFVLI